MCDYHNVLYKYKEAVAHIKLITGGGRVEIIVHYAE